MKFEAKNYKALAEAYEIQFNSMPYEPERIGFPAQGRQHFEIETVNGETCFLSRLNGVILYDHPHYAYFQNSGYGKGEVPVCTSYDGLKGSGYPGGDCSKCRFNEWGSGNGKGKACRQRRIIYILREGVIYPFQLDLPVASAPSFSKYIRQLSCSFLRPAEVVTAISLETIKNPTFSYSRAVFTMERELTEEEKEAVKPLTEKVKVYAESLVKNFSDDEDSIEDYINPDTGEFCPPLI